MNDYIPDLNRAVDDLQTVLDAGLLIDLKEEVAYARRGRPRDPFDEMPWLKASVEGFGDLLADFTGLPPALCKLAALNQLMPGNRQRTALEVLREFADRILSQANQANAATLLAAERRRSRA
ncbi:MAG: hypothetical protein IT424_06160 [Pirellulales bacterium]|nr:hypothetical protein [Pirellulales bacterium]